MNNTSKQKNILILGSNSDIALDLLAKLEILNHNLILHYNKNNNLIYKNKKFIKNIFIKADLQKTHEVKRMFQTIKKKFSHLDIIICNFSTYDNSKKINQGCYPGEYPRIGFDYLYVNITYKLKLV